MEDSDIFAGKVPRIRMFTQPQDANVWGQIHGGVLLTHLDNAGGIAALERARTRVVTLMVKEARFCAPTQVGDLLNVYAEVTKVGRTSLTAAAQIVAERLDVDTHRVTSTVVMTAELIYVAVDERGRKIPVREHLDTELQG